MAEVRRTGEVLSGNTLVTGGGLVILTRVLELAYTHKLLQRPSAWAWPEVIAFLQEYEVQMVAGTVAIWGSNLWRASRLVPRLKRVIERELDEVIEEEEASGSVGVGGRPLDRSTEGPPAPSDADPAS